MGLELRDIRKHFGPVRANDGVNMHVATGSLHGLLGENGAGKSTLMKILSGYYVADSGEVVLDGASIELGSPRAATRSGIGMLHQDPLVFLPMSVLDNILLGSPGGRFLRRDPVRAQLLELRDRFGFSYDLDAPVRTLGIGERQQVEITRLLWLGMRVLILDEPTTGISADQRTLLFRTLRELAADGMSVLFVSHKLEEVEELCERVTVMRRGTVVGAAELPVPPSDLVTMMFGEPVEMMPRPLIATGAVVLSLREAAFEERHIRLEDLSLDVASGEVIGLAGMEGSGQGTFLRGVSGLVRAGAGSVAVHGRDITGRDHRARLDDGVYYLPAGRLEEGLVEGLSIAEHLILADRIGGGLLIDWDAARLQAAERIRHYSIKGTVDSTAESLSGGNQQRLLLAMLPDDLAVLLMEHPTRGLDIGSADWVWTQLLERRKDGTAILFASADIDELLRYSDRILVFFAGRVIAELDASRTSVDEIGHLIGGRIGSTSRVRA
jgi:general nucleoside transport system ATP-binding protein